jgi:hypothetical protein
MLGAPVAAFAFMALVIRRTAGLPGLRDDSGQWDGAGLLSPAVEDLFAMLFVWALATGRAVLRAPMIGRPITPSTRG